MDTAAFAVYIRQVLVLTLRPGHIIVLDNLRVYKAAHIEEAIAACGCTLLFLPTFSPDLTPIEQAFAKLKPFPCGSSAAGRVRRSSPL